MNDVTERRRAYALSGLNLDGLGLEVGPSHSPLVPKGSGIRVETLDHLDKAALIEKYKARLDTTLIDDVDHVWSGESYPDLLGEARYDWVIASHVIEHVPDFVGFLNDCRDILKPDGVLSLVVPDKRYCFDHYRPLTGLGQMIDAHLEKRTKPTPGSAVEMVMYVSRLNGLPDWTAEDPGVPNLFLPTFIGADVLQRTMAGEYYDCHSWCFTPSSFRLILEDLNILGLTTMREAAFRPSVGMEFYVQLSATAAPVIDRFALMQSIRLENTPPAGY